VQAGQVIPGHGGNPLFSSLAFALDEDPGERSDAPGEYFHFGAVRESGLSRSRLSSGSRSGCVRSQPVTVRTEGGLTSGVRGVARKGRR